MSEVIGAMLAHTQDRHSRELKDIAWRTANANNTGFKKSLSIHEIQNIKTPGGRQYSIPKYHGKMINMAQGSLKSTNNPHHAALVGNGMFVVESPDGRQLLTRRGSFHTNQAGELVTPEGYKVLGEGGVIILPVQGGPYKFTQDGTISNANGPINKFLVQTVDPQDYFQLHDIGGYFIYPDTVAPIPAEQYMVHQGAVENANVYAAEEAANMANIARYSGAVQKYATQHYENRKRLIELGAINV